MIFKEIDDLKAELDHYRPLSPELMEAIEFIKEIIRGERKITESLIKEPHGTNKKAMR